MPNFNTLILIDFNMRGENVIGQNYIIPVDIKIFSWCLMQMLLSPFLCRD